MSQPQSGIHGHNSPEDIIANLALAGRRLSSMTSLTRPCCSPMPPRSRSSMPQSDASPAAVAACRTRHGVSSTPPRCTLQASRGLGAAYFVLLSTICIKSRSNCKEADDGCDGDDHHLGNHTVRRLQYVNFAWTLYPILRLPLNCINSLVGLRQHSLD
ncbi:hypothetical protein BS78_05G137000 [Paspalum vaginatum]|nr:hypothetical protein BS78_05G137000 [Paspalum vaginatum]